MIRDFAATNTTAAATTTTNTTTTTTTAAATAATAAAAATLTVRMVSIAKVILIGNVLFALVRYCACACGSVFLPSIWCGACEHHSSPFLSFAMLERNVSGQASLKCIARALVRPKPKRRHLHFSALERVFVNVYVCVCVCAFDRSSAPLLAHPPPPHTGFAPVKATKETPTTEQTQADLSNPPFCRPWCVAKRWRNRWIPGWKEVKEYSKGDLSHVPQSPINQAGFPPPPPSVGPAVGQNFNNSTESSRKAKKKEGEGKTRGSRNARGWGWGRTKLLHVYSFHFCLVLLLLRSSANTTTAGPQQFSFVTRTCVCVCVCPAVLRSVPHCCCVGFPPMLYREPCLPRLAGNVFFFVGQ